MNHNDHRIDIRRRAAGAPVWRSAPEWLVLLAIIVGAAWLRLRELNLVEFKLDEATAVDLARHLLDGDLPTVGLTSSVGARNPPLFIYLVSIPLAVRDDPLAATVFVGVLGVVAVALTYLVLRPRFGAMAALASAGLFATAPWAVLFGRKIWAQDLLPVFNVALLWSLFLVLERARTRVIVVVPVLLCLTFQLNFSALALLAPSALVLLFRSREVHWRAFAIGVGVSVALLTPWLAHEATHHFEDIPHIVGGGVAGAIPGAGSVMAAWQTTRITGALGWDFVAGSDGVLRADMNVAWTLGMLASAISAALLIGGLCSVTVCLTRSVELLRTWPLVDMPVEVAHRALLLAWTLGTWIAYAPSAPGRVYPHYLIVAYPASFAVQGVLLSDISRMLAARGYRMAQSGPVILATAVCIAFAAFTVGFHNAVDELGGTPGDYGIAYRDQAALARVLKHGGLRVADDVVLDFLVAGDLDSPLGTQPPAKVWSRFEHQTSPSCNGELHTIGALEACIPMAR